jgi:hypothetical protein
MSAFLFNLRGTNFTIVDSGSVLNAEFVKLYEQFLDNQPSNHLDFDKAAIEYFDTRIKELPFNEDFFTSFTSIWRFFTETHRFQEAESVWGFALDTVKQWEQSNSPKVIHKGTPYYFLAVTVILSGDIDRGFLLMHQALEEDKNNSGGFEKELPAYAFVTLNYQKQDQAFRSEVLDTAKYLESLIDKYRNKYSSSLTLEEFRSRFFNIPSLNESIFLLVFILTKVKNLSRKTELALRKNAFAGLFETGILFDLCLVIDSTLHHKNATQYRYIEQMEFLSKSCGFTLNNPRLGELNTGFNHNFTKMITDILNETWTFQDGSHLSLPEINLALSYGLRNFSAHKIVSVPVIYQRFEDIFQRVINVLFLSVEKLYKIPFAHC